MAMFLFTDKILRDKPIQVFNHGNMKRDFTYIDDVITGTRSGIDKNYKCEVFNLGNHRSEELMDVVHLIEESLGKKAIIDFQPKQSGDVSESFADIQYSTEKLCFTSKTPIEDGIPSFIEWYRNFYE